MKNFAKIISMLILTLPFFAHASDGAEALQMSHERTRAFLLNNRRKLRSTKGKCAKRLNKKKRSY
ncbi:hypothetical protein K814_0125890 [Pseudomonas fluorescens LMG 5329]|uniref:Uncharacterized protein n=1 Tax=Pseudomonas fluorescens LMG 5329 TaxID=1324332 RepID=A0A0A1YW13_PSEFL|nr:hypothetical protein K814_0125890 [Pseudomonas fluorescens LMG 5329]